MADTDSHKVRILIVDDEEVVVNLTKDALEDDGFDLYGTTSAEEALSMMGHREFDLLVCDIRMPGMSGIELAERVHETYPDIGVIFMTGYANLNSAKDAIKQGAMDYIMKPFELHEIRQSVRNAVNARRESAALRQTDKLHHLSDLNKLLFTANDLQSIIVSSLRFAMIHQSAPLGAVLYRKRYEDVYVLITIDGNTVEEGAVLEGDDALALDSCDCSGFSRPIVLQQLSELPLVFDDTSLTIYNAVQPDWMSIDTASVAIPVRRSDKLTAVMLLSFRENSLRIREADLTFLEVTADQLAMSLDNVRLLEETQQAYARLRELQDETIDLEKLATRGQLSAEIGHELNNFLGVVAGNLSLLDFHLKKEHYAELEKYVATMTETVEKMKRFTGNLMDLRTGSTKRELAFFDHIIGEVIEYLRPQKRFKDVQIEIVHLDTDISMQADSTQILQLLYNLFNNAADATRECEQKRITVEVRRHDERESFRFTISDTGTGFSQEKLEKAFHEKFTTKESGHGFGLVVCRRIIDQHGGRVDVQSAQGEGTTISVEFPIAQLVESEDPAAVTTATAAAVSPS
jgi:signal transduction histidine kinase/CheY-like chemotaxis protein